jgi:signal recognition particle GTPase
MAKKEDLEILVEGDMLLAAAQKITKALKEERAKANPDEDKIAELVEEGKKTADKFNNFILTHFHIFGEHLFN